MRYFLAITFLIGVLGFATFSTAQNDNSKNDVEVFIDLSEDQVLQMKSILKSFIDDRDKSGYELRKLRLELDALLYSKKSNISGIHRIKKKIVNIHEHRIDEKIAYVNSIRQLLTPIQFSEWLDFRLRPDPSIKRSKKRSLFGKY